MALRSNFPKLVGRHSLPALSVARKKKKVKKHGKTSKNRMHKGNNRRGKRSPTNYK